jgi:hypothetical protein
MKKNNTNGKKKKGMTAGKILALGAGVAALGAGAYYFMGPDSKEHKKKVSALTKKIKKEVSQKVSKVKNITEPMYHKTIDTLVGAYGKEYKIHEKEIKALADKLKGQWKGSKNKTSKKSATKNKKR